MFFLEGNGKTKPLWPMLFYRLWGWSFANEIYVVFFESRGTFITEMLIANQRFEATLNFQPLEHSLLMVKLLSKLVGVCHPGT